MKEDYLWDKTGTADPDIEKLENALAVFRYKETAPPELQPAKVLPFKKDEPQPQRRIFSFAAAAAACLIFGIIALGVWIQLSGNNAETRADLAETAKPEIAEPEIPIIERNVDLPVETVENPKQFSAQKIAAMRRNAPVKIRRKQAKPRTDKTRKTEIILTKEEQYAYDQLMLALSITSSKFKLVKDKVEGTEEKNAVVGNGQ